MKFRRIFPIILLVGMLLSLLSLGASAETYAISHVNCQSYPNSSNGNTLPFVSQNYSDFYCTTTTAGVTVTGWSLIDSNGNACSGKVENRPYTLNIYVASQAVNYLFNAGTGASINNESATVTVAADGMSATISRQIYPLLIAPTIWHSPTDESHNSGEIFSFTASASPYYDTYQWYLCSSSGMQIVNAEDVGNISPGATATISDEGTYVRCNLHNVDYRLDGWQVYCTFTGVAGGTTTGSATIHVLNAVQPTPTPTPTPAPTPTPTPVPTPEPTPEITVAESPSPVILDTPEEEGITVVTEDWADTWSEDADYHWHASKIPQNTDVSDKATHTMVWKVTTPATSKADGVETGTCSVCGYTETRSVAYVSPISALSLTGSTFGVPNLAFYAAGAAGILMILAAAGIGIGNAVSGIKARHRRNRRYKY